MVTADSIHLLVSLTTLFPCPLPIRGTQGSMSPEGSRRPRGTLKGPEGEHSGLGNSWMLSRASWWHKTPGVQATSQTDGGGGPGAGRVLWCQEACPRSFHLPYPGYPGMVLALRQGWGELIRATPLRLWFTRFDSSERVTLVPIHWEDEGLGPSTSQAPGGV